MSTATAKPGTKAPKAAKQPKEKVARKDYAAPQNAEWVDKDGKFTRKPDDFNVKAHKPLKRSDFADEGTFYEMQVESAKKRLASAESRLNDYRKLGGVKDRNKAKRLITMQKKLSELSAQLKADGVDVDALMASLVAANGEKA